MAQRTAMREPRASPRQPGIADCHRLACRSSTRATSPLRVRDRGHSGRPSRSRLPSQRRPASAACSGQRRPGPSYPVGRRARRARALSSSSWRWKATRRSYPRPLEPRTISSVGLHLPGYACPVAPQPVLTGDRVGSIRGGVSQNVPSTPNCHRRGTTHSRLSLSRPSVHGVLAR